MALVRTFKIVLLAGLGLLLAALAAGIAATARSAAALPAPFIPPPADPATEIVQQASEVVIERSRRGVPTLRLEAAGSTTTAGGALDLQQVSLILFAPDGSQTRVQAPRARSLPGGQHRPAARGGGGGQGGFSDTLQGIGSWHLEGGVTVAGPGELRLSVPSLDYSEQAGAASSADLVSFSRGPAIGSAVGMSYDVRAQRVSFHRDVTASMELAGFGEVKVQAGSGVYDPAARRFEMERYEAATSRGEVLQGSRLAAVFRQEGGIERLEGDRGFELNSTHSVPLAGPSTPLSRLLALGGRRTMRGQRLAIRFTPQGEPEVIDVFGQANLTSGEGAPSSIEAEQLTFNLLEGGLSQASASGGVAVKGAPEGPSGGFQMNSRSLEASFDPKGGSLLGVQGEGGIHLRDQGVESQGSRTVLDPNTDVITLTGDGGNPARATWMQRTIEVKEGGVIEVDRRRRTLTARGGVRVSYQPEPPRAGEDAAKRGSMPFFRGGETIHAVADSLSFADEGRRAHYEGQVRLWQGESRLEAGSVDLNEAAGTLEASKDVASTFRQPPPERAGAAPFNPSSDLVTVSANVMTYQRDADRLLYRGRVLVTQGTTRATSEELLVHLAAGGGSAERMEAAGQVEVRDAGRIGRGDAMVVDLRADTIRLAGKGREAVVQDELNQQVVRGAALTMDRSGDRILVESELGGRTWITLKPRQKGAPGVGSDPDN